MIDPKNSPRSSRRVSTGQMRTSNPIDVPPSSNASNKPFSRSPHKVIPQYPSSSPNQNSPFKTLLLGHMDTPTIPEDSFCEPYSKSPTSTLSSYKRNTHQLHSASPVALRRQISQERISRQYSTSPSNVLIDHRKPDSLSSNSSSSFKRTSIEESFITDSMLLKSSKSGTHARRHLNYEGGTGTRLRSNTLPRVKSRESSSDHHGSLPNDDSFNTYALSKKFFMSGLVDKDDSSPMLGMVKPFSNSDSRKSSTSAVEPFLMEISEEEPFTNCITALADATVIVDEIMRMAKQRESNMINFSKELFSLVCGV